MRRAARVHINHRAELSETPRGARVIEMNVAEKNVADVGRVETDLRKIDNDIVESRFGAGVEKREACVRFERGRSDDSAMTELARVENVNIQTGASNVPRQFVAPQWQGDSLSTSAVRGSSTSSW